MDSSVDGLRCWRSYGELMSRSQETLRTSVTWFDVAFIVVSAIIGLYQGTYSTGLLCGIAAGIVLGIWRLIRFTGKILEYVQASAEGAYEPDPSDV
jgi:hypothetical protein